MTGNQPAQASAGYRLAMESYARAWAPPPRMTISEWADARRTITEGPEKGGPWRTSRIPYLAAIQDALLPSHPAPVVVFLKSSQTGGTTIAGNWIGRTIEVEPDDFLVVFPGEKMGRRWARGKLNRMIATTPSLRNLIALSVRSNGRNSLLEKTFRGGRLVIGSANIPTDLAMESAPYVLCDELDRMPEDVGGEGDPVELALRRSATFTRRKAFLISTPTGEDSRTWQWWRQSTMSRYYVPCVHCGHMQWLRWDQLKWPVGKPKQAAYLCEECAALIDEGLKTDMLAAGEWRAEHPERESEVAGFHVSGLYTPIGLGDTWAQHAAAWERAQGKQARLQVFYNTRLGEIYAGDRRALAWEDVKSRAEPYALRSIPAGVLVLTSHTDVQKDRLETQIIGWGRGEQATVIDYQVHVGDPTRDEVWAELDAYLGRPIVNSFGVPMLLACSLVDSGYLTDHVLNFTRPRRARAIFASRGSQTATRPPIGRPTYPDTKKRGRRVQPDKRGAERYELGVSAIKAWLFEQLRADVGADGQFVPPAERHVRFPAGLPDEYFRGLASEVYDPKEGWVVRYERNEPLDTFVGARAAALHHRVGIDRLGEADWARLEALYEPKEGAERRAADEPAPATQGGLTIEHLRAMVPRVNST